jgi:hypothetical protein
MRVTGAVTSIDAAARRPVDGKARYHAIAATTGVPWFVIAVIREREASQDWTRSIAQGDPWDRVSIHVPKGRRPFRSWAEAAVDALSFCAPYAARNKDWSAGGALTLLEGYNGLGRRLRGWCGRLQHRRACPISASRMGCASRSSVGSPSWARQARSRKPALATPLPRRLISIRRPSIRRVSRAQQWNVWATSDALKSV